MRIVWAGVKTVLLVAGEVLPLPLLWLAWRETSFVIPFLGPPVRIGLLPVWWAVAAVVFSYAAALVDAVRSRNVLWPAVLPPLHAVRGIARLWQQV